MKMPRPLPLLTAMSLSCLLAGCASTSSHQGGSSSDYPASGPTISRMGSVGAADFDRGYILLGAGRTMVDLYIDPMCPYCRAFEESELPYLRRRIDRQEITLRIHPIALLNRLSQGSAYSTRASAAIADVAASNPSKVLPFLSALYTAQPDENSSGLTDQELRDLEAKVGALRTYTSDKTRNWVEQQTLLSTHGPLQSTKEIYAIDHVPTVVVNGSVFPGNSDDVHGFQKFAQEHR